MSKETIIIIDYGSGNLRSAAKAFEHVCEAEGLNADIKISARPEDLRSASRIVLPGQGAFGDCIDNLRTADGMIEALEDTVLRGGKPFLGICVGMQLLAEKGFEHGEHTGLGWIEGSVTALEPMPDTDGKALKIPHMGWNEATLPKAHPVLGNQMQHYYFVHSYMMTCKNESDILAHCDYGGKFVAAAGRDNIIGVQFHPEKSQESGLRLLSNFMAWKP